MTPTVESKSRIVWTEMQDLDSWLKAFDIPKWREKFKIPYDQLAIQSLQPWLTDLELLCAKPIELKQSNEIMLLCKELFDAVKLMDSYRCMEKRAM